MNPQNDVSVHATKQADVTPMEFEILRAAVEGKKYYLPIKRALDILLSAALLIVLAPLMLAVALLVMMSSPGPVLYRAQRYGQHGIPFTMLKFRSMFVAKPDEDRAFKLRVSSTGELAKSSTDPRITPSVAGYAGGASMSRRN